MKRTVRLFASLAVPSAVILAASAPAAADPPSSDPMAGMSLHERQIWEERKVNLEKTAAGATTACGTTINAAFDIASFKGQDVDKVQPAAACRDAVLVLKTFCSDDVGKAAVQRSVSTVTCRSSTTGTKPVLNGKELVVNIDAKSTSIQLEGKGNGWSWGGALAELVHAPNAEAGQPDMPLRERRHWDEIVAQRNKDAESASKNCETTIKARVDIASFKGLDIEKNPPGGKCRDAILTLGSMCAFSPVAKKTVQSKVTNVVCKSSTEGTKPTLADHTLTVHVDPNKSVNGSWKSALESTL